MSLIEAPLMRLEGVYGSDLTIANAARVSFGKRKTEIDEADKRLINFLVREKHWSTLRHCAATMVVTTPIFIARQIWKHQVGMDYTAPCNINEQSGRYVTADREDFWQPQTWRKAAPNVKQGSSNELVWQQSECTSVYLDAVRHAYDAYLRLLDIGVCKEQARGVLPQSELTQFWMTGTLEAWAHFYKLRIDAHAQKEIQVYAHEAGDVMSEHFPVAWEALTK